MLTAARRPLADATQRELQQSSRFIAVATAGVVVYSVTLPLFRFYAIAASPLKTGRVTWALAALACYLPLLVWLVLSAARDQRGRGQAWALAAVAAVLFGALPLVGVGWVGMLYMFAALVLAGVGVRPPWSWLLYAALVAAPTPLTLALGHPEFALDFTVGMLYAAVPLAVGIWLIRAARQLQAERLALMEQAVVRERLGIDRELRATVGAELQRIAAMGDRAGGLAASDPAAAAEALRALVDAARRTLAEARRMVTRYREVSLRAELETAVTLLAAAGIHARLALPPGELPATVDERERAALRHDIARLLGGTAPAAVTIAVSSHDGQVRLEPCAEPDPVPAEGPAR